MTAKADIVWKVERGCQINAMSTKQSFDMLQSEVPLVFVNSINAEEATLKFGTWIIGSRFLLFGI